MTQIPKKNGAEARQDVLDDVKMFKDPLRQPKNLYAELIGRAD